MSEPGRRERRPRIGLYYPYIHFRDVDWLKMAVLFWDGLTRIVPTQYAPQDSRAVRDLRESYPEFLADDPPDLNILEHVGYPFMVLIEGRQVELRAQFGVRRVGDDVVLSHGVVSNRELLGDKLFKGLTTALLGAGLAIVKRGPHGVDEVYVDPKVADVYMAALAGEMAKRNKFLPVTNRPADHLAVSGLEVDRIAEALFGLKTRPLGNHEIQESMAVLGLSMVMPKTLEGVPMTKVVKFRREHQEELRAYQEFVERLTAPGGPLDDLTEIDDQRALRAHLTAAYRTELEPKIKVLRNELNGIGLETTHSAATVILKRLGKVGGIGAGAVATGMLAPPFAPLFAAGAIGLGIFSVAQQREGGARKKVLESPVAYLMYAQEELTPGGALRRLKSSARRFAIGA